MEERRYLNESFMKALDEKLGLNEAQQTDKEGWPIDTAYGLMRDHGWKPKPMQGGHRWTHPKHEGHNVFTSTDATIHDTSFSHDNELDSKGSGNVKAGPKKTLRDHLTDFHKKVSEGSEKLPNTIDYGTCDDCGERQDNCECEYPPKKTSECEYPPKKTIEAKGDDALKQAWKIVGDHHRDKVSKAANAVANDKFQGVPDADGDDGFMGHAYKQAERDREAGKKPHINVQGIKDFMSKRSSDQDKKVDEAKYEFSDPALITNKQNTQSAYMSDRDDPEKRDTEDRTGHRGPDHEAGEGLRRSRRS
jgi:hypothetical protein